MATPATLTAPKPIPSPIRPGDRGGVVTGSAHDTGRETRETGTMATITLSRSRPFGYTITAEDGRDLLVQLDYDYPGTASTFGWYPGMVGPNDTADSCDHRATDGTIDCPDCGTPAGTFIAAAAEWLDSHDGATADDPGYFSGDPCWCTRGFAPSDGPDDRPVPRASTRFGRVPARGLTRRPSHHDSAH